MKKFFWDLFSVLSLVFFFSFTNPVFSQSACGIPSSTVSLSGSICTSFPQLVLNPLITTLNGTAAALQTQYINQVLNTINTATVLANLNSGMVGPGNVNRWQVGVSGSLAGGQKDNITVVFGDQRFSNLPNIGASIVPNVNVAFNLGWIMGGGPSDNYPEYRTILHKFTVYLHGFSFNFANQETQNLVQQRIKNLQLGGETTSGGFMVRYQLFDNLSSGRWGAFEFSGVNIGMGVHYLRQTLNLNYADPTPLAITLGQGISGTWRGTSNFNYSSSVTSIPLDIRTGVRFFYLFTVFAGVGTSVNIGNSSLAFTRSGPIDINQSTGSSASVPASALGISVSGLTGGGVNTSGLLGLNVRGTARPQSSLGYVVGGLELNVLMIKVLAEAYVSGDIQSVQLGAKVAF